MAQFSFLKVSLAIQHLLCFYNKLQNYYPAIKKYDIMPFVAPWMGLEIIILSEVNQIEKDKYHKIEIINFIT